MMQHSQFPEIRSRDSCRYKVKEKKRLRGPASGCRKPSSPDEKLKHNTRFYVVQHILTKYPALVGRPSCQKLYFWS